MKYEDLTKEILEKHTGKTVVWFEQHKFFKKYIRVHYDSERYLSDCEDILIEEIK